MGLFSTLGEPQPRDLRGELLAFLSRKFEGVQKIHATKIEERERVLRHTFKLAGLPFPTAQVAELTEGTEQQFPRQHEAGGGSANDCHQEWF